ncbi:MAG: FMN-binding protein [Candidatus Latescibacteria bacterium]|nr:FMN-binding protein [Candidatus Latescibacterota bacterium]MCK5381335.1 FMN-binding protein [Candidatus Latescibacterota bacterium]
MKGRLRVGLVLSGIILLCSLGDVFGAVLLKPGKALERMLPGAEKVIKEAKTLSVDQKKLILKTGKWKTVKDNYSFYVGKSKGETTGVALIIDEPGKHNKIRIIVGMEPDGKVKDVAVMAHVEKRGGAIKERRFLKQFIGKSSKDPIMVGKDIDGVTKATVSCRAVGVAVKKAVNLYDVLYLRAQEAPAAKQDQEAE